MDIYRTEEEQIEAVKSWWQENGKSIIAGVVIGLAAIFGWRGWQNHSALQAEAASTLYQQMINASRNGERDDIKVYADRIIADHATSAYGLFAGLMLARLAAEAGDLAGAETHLNRVLADNNEAGIEHIARLRLARVLIARERLDEALRHLNVDDRASFAARYEELKGDIFVKQGKKQEAQAAYQAALAEIDMTSELQAVLELKLDELGRI